MDEEIDRLVVSVRADTRAFASDVAAMRAELDGPFADGLERAGAALERGLTSAIQRGKFGFEDLRRVALSVLSEIAAAAIRSGLKWGQWRRRWQPAWQFGEFAWRSIGCAGPRDGWPRVAGPCVSCRRTRA